MRQLLIASSVLSQVLGVALPLLSVRVGSSGSGGRGENGALVLALRSKLRVEGPLLAAGLVGVAAVSDLGVVQGHHQRVANHVLVRRLGGVLVYPRGYDLLLLIGARSHHALLSLHSVLVLYALDHSVQIAEPGVRPVLHGHVPWVVLAS